MKAYCLGCGLSCLNHESGGLKYYTDYIQGKQNIRVIFKSVKICDSDILDKLGV